MVILGVKITDRSLIRGLGRRMSAFHKQVLIDSAHFWHEKILQRHWDPSARAAYGYRPRSRKYERTKRRSGRRFIDLFYTGQSRRWLLETVNVTATSGRVTLRMRAPWYFKNPNGQIRNARSKKFSSRMQPNKPDEITRFNNRDRQDVGRFGNDRLRRLMQEARQSTTTIING